MIDIISENGVQLKNITQVGTPEEEEKIYIEDTVYRRIHMEDFQEQRVFVLMGHTECSSGKYTTFVQGVIPVYDIAFSGHTPVWTNRCWNEVFGEIKRAYADLSIVGWALDRKGILPTVTDEIEAVHREHFGGLHQIFFLLDTAGQEEYVYLNKRNHLYRKNGFCIYYSAERRKNPKPEIELQITPEQRGFQNSAHREVRAWQSYQSPDSRDRARQAVREKEDTTSKPHRSGSGQYRQMLLAQQAGHGHGADFRPRRRSRAFVMAVAFLVTGTLAAAFYLNPWGREKVDNVVETINSNIKTDKELQKPFSESDYVIHFSSEKEEEAENGETAVTEILGEPDTQASLAIDGATQNGVPLIPVEEISGDIPSH